MATTRRPAPFTMVAIVLSLAGVALAGYLTWVRFDSSALVCGLGDCQTVQASEFATVGPVPVALLGLGMYATVLACSALARWRPEWAVSALSIAFAVALAGAVYALYLTWLEVAVINAICQWCVVSAVLTLVLTGVLAAALWQVFAVALPGDAETEPEHAAS